MKKLKNSLLCTLMCLSVSQLFAQGFKYEKVEDSPEDINFVQAGIGLWDMNLAGYNFSLWNFNPKLCVYVDRKFKLEGEFSHSLLDRFYPESPTTEFEHDFSTVTSIYKATGATQTSLIGTYYFRNIVKTENIRVHLKTEGRVNYVSDIPGQVLHSTGVRLGYTGGSTLYTLNDLAMKGMEGGQPVAFNFNSNATTMATYSMIKAGIGFNSVYNFKIKTDKYGMRESKGMYGWYVDAFVPLTFTLDDVWMYTASGYSSTSSNATLIHQVSIDKYNTKMPLGGAIGFYSTNFKGGGFGWGAEGGVLPGLTSGISENVYVRINLSYQFAFRF